MAGIIVGIDGSHHSERALNWAMNEAALRHAALTVLSVHPVIHGWSGRAAPMPEDDPLVEQTRTAAQEATDKALAGLGGTRPESVSVVAISGIPAQALLDTAASADADMIVVGSRGAGGFERLAMGSVGDQVARHAHCPVVIIPKQKKG